MVKKITARFAHCIPITTLVDLPRSLLTRTLQRTSPPFEQLVIFDCGIDHSHVCLSR